MPDDDDQRIAMELVDWLVSVEGLAHDVYTATAEALRADPKLSSFVALLADNEKQHTELMNGIRTLIADRTQLPASDLRLDAALRESVEAPLRQLRSEVVSGTITRKRAVSLIAEVEFAEWNEVFLYVLGKYGSQGREMETMAATIQEHERSIAGRLPSIPTSGIALYLFPSSRGRTP